MVANLCELTDPALIIRGLPKASQTRIHGQLVWVTLVLRVFSWDRCRPQLPTWWHVAPLPHSRVPAACRGHGSVSLAYFFDTKVPTGRSTAVHALSQLSCGQLGWACDNLCWDEVGLSHSRPGLPMEVGYSLCFTQRGTTLLLRPRGGRRAFPLATSR